MRRIKNSFLLSAIADQGHDGYLMYHAPRYELLLHLIEQCSINATKILDIGRSPFSDIAFRATHISIDTLGFEPDGVTETGFNYQFDLNQTQFVNLWRRDLPQYQTIIFSEVIEHLYTAPVLVLRFLRSLLTQDGFIIIQTPNAVVLHKRVQMLLGKNPYNLISEQQNNPTHYREYTYLELLDFCKSAELNVLSLTYENYFDYKYTNHLNNQITAHKLYRLINYLYDLLPRSFSPGLCCVAQNSKVF